MRIILSSALLTGMVSGCKPQASVTPEQTNNPTASQTVPSLVTKITQSPVPSETPYPTFTPTPPMYFCDLGEFVGYVNEAIQYLVQQNNPLYTSQSGAVPNAKNELWLKPGERFVYLNSILEDYITKCNTLDQMDLYLQKIDPKTGEPILDADENPILYALDDDLSLDTYVGREGYEDDIKTSVAWSGGGKYQLASRVQGQYDVQSIDLSVYIRFSQAPTSTPVPGNTGNGNNGGTDPTAVPTCLPGWDWDPVLGCYQSGDVG